MLTTKLPPIFALAALITGLFASPTSVQACACCDGGNERQVVGWSTSGRSALVESRATGCSDFLAFEIMRQDQNTPVGCFDAYSPTPSRRVACEGFVDGFDRFGDTDTRPSGTTRLREYPQRPEVLSPAIVRASLTTPVVLEPGYRSSTLQVQLFIDDTWVSVFTHTVMLGAPEQLAYNYFDDEDDGIHEITLPVAVRIWPSPSGERALLEMSGHNASPGMGFFPDEMFWITLPQTNPDDTAALPRAAPDTAAPSLATLPFDNTAPEPTARDAARRLNSFGLAAHRSGQFAVAARLFTMALYIDPASSAARYNLACALSRMGAIEPAFVLIEQIRNGGCQRCRARIRRARVDEDLRALWPRFR